MEEIPAKALSGRVLIMDDEKTVSSVLARMLRTLGLEPEVTSDGENALLAYQEARASGNEFALVILDLTVPGGLGGKGTMNRLRDLDPNAKAIVTSGYSNDPVMSEFRAHGFLGALPKPYNKDQVADVVVEVLLED